jgi:hypothetical protein
MMHGRKVWEAAVADAENLADVPLRFINGIAQLEDALYEDVRAYDEVTGRENSFYDDRAEEDMQEYRTWALAPLRGARTPETVGEYAVRWPRLWARYASRPERLELVRRLEEAGQRYQSTQ